MEYRDHTQKSYVAENHPEVLSQGYHYDGGEPLPTENDRAEKYYSADDAVEGEEPSPDSGETEDPVDPGTEDPVV